MEVIWIVDRSRLRALHQEHPDWTKARLAEEVGRSHSWVKKWLKRLAQTGADDESVLFSQSRAPKEHPKRVKPAVERKVLEIRDHPPGNLARVPGPVTILYYLHQDKELQESGDYLPRSSSTIWAILDQHQRILRPRASRHEPEERPDPLSHVQIDFKSVSTVPPDPDGKQQHVVETLNIVDKGTSILLTATPREDYNAETVITALVDSWLVHGLPEAITFDRDPRFVGSWTSKEFPSPFMRLLLCLGIRVDVCPAHRPQKNGFVERYHRSYQSECLAPHQPHSLAETVRWTTEYQQHYNGERPNQALSCGNQPPRVAFPDLPRRPSLPTTLDLDSWLDRIHGRLYPRRVNQSGTVKAGGHTYYISRQLHRQTIALRVDAPEKRLVVLQDNRVFKYLPLKGLYNGVMLFEDYLPLIQAEAVSDYRRHLQQHHRYH
jgi:transposase InsO family protein